MPAITCFFFCLIAVSSNPATAQSETSSADELLAKDTLSVSVTGLDEPLKDNVEAFLQIVQLAESDQPLPGEARLRWLHEQADDDIQQALQPFGYYRPTIQSALETTPEGWHAQYSIDPGSPLKIEQISVRVTGPGSDDNAFQRVLNNLPLHPGDVLEHQKYEEIKQKLQAVATERGYFDARLTSSQIRIDLEAYQAIIDLELNSGERYRYGPITFEQDTLRQEFLQNYLHFKPGDPYFAPDLLRLQSDLINSQFFDQALIDASPEHAEDLRIPVNVQLTMRKRTKYTFGLGYGTDTGVRGRADMERRWVNSRGHRLDLRALIAEKKSDITMGYYIPSDDPQRNALKFGLQFETENSDVKNSVTGRVRVSRDVKWGKWTGEYGGEYLWERFDIADEEQITRLLGFEMTLGRVNAKNRLRVKNGYALNTSFYVASDAFVSDISFVQLAADAKWITSFNDNNRLLLRAQAGTTWISDDDFDSLPSSKRFFTGGDNSIRGYALDTVAPRDDEGNVLGGRHLLVGSVEYEYRILEQWSIAAFIDTGDAFDDTIDLRTGVGFGLRWQSPVGPIRVDLAHGLEEPGDTVRLHLNIGPDL
ncbi:MAG: autotransporter assembly complex family protein [Gammaproteobacteria bacterium]